MTCLLACLGVFTTTQAQSGSYTDWYKEYNDSVQGIRLNEAIQYLNLKKIAPKKRVIVGIIDSGIDTTLVDIKAALWTNPKEKPDGKDNDKNGYVDDIHGWNFLGTADGSFNMTSAGTQDFREFKRLYPKYKEVKEVSEVEDPAEYAYYEEMKRKAGITNYIKFAHYMGSKNEAYHYMDKVLSQQPDLNKDTLSLKGLMHLSLATEEWNNACQLIFTDLYKVDKKMLWADFLEQHKNAYHLVNSRISGIEHEPDKRLLMGDNLADPKDRFYGNPILQVEGCEHGTAVAGLIAAQGITHPEHMGVYPDAQLMIIRAVPDGDEYDKDIASAIRYAVDNGAKVINLSLGKYNSPHSTMVNEAIAYAAKKDVLLIQAAGNDGKNIDEVNYFPSALNTKGERLNNYLRVGSTNLKGERSKFSNYGTTQVDVFAPGEQLVCHSLGDKLMISQGTSLSAPIVSGLAALLRAHFPKLKAHQIKDILVRSVRPKTIEQLSQSGSGVVDALQAVQLAKTYKKR